MTTRGSSRASPSWFIVLCLGFLSLFLTAHDAFSQTRPRLLVYLHGNIKPRVLQSALADRLPGAEVVVLSRYRDFARELANNPDAVLALEPVLAFHGLSVGLRGVRGGQDTERYVLVSIGGTVPKDSFSSLTVGVVDLLGREPTKKFVARLLGLHASPPLKYAVKTEDLLPLLQFRSADAVLVSERDAEEIRSSSKLELRVTPLDTRVGLASVSFRTDAGRNGIKSGILALDLATNRNLEVEGWR